MREPRLGDDIDDFCVRCKRITNHVIVSVVNAEAAKVRCRTCHNDHDFRHEQAPPPKVDPRKAALFNEVLKKVSPGDVPDEIVLEPDAIEGLDATEIDAAESPDGEPEVDVEVPPIEAPPKVKARGRARK